MVNEDHLKQVYHVATRRLFESCWGQGDIHLDDWELNHLAECEECSHIRDVFARQSAAMKTGGSDNEVP